MCNAKRFAINCSILCHNNDKEEKKMAKVLREEFKDQLAAIQGAAQANLEEAQAKLDKSVTDYRSSCDALDELVSQRDAAKGQFFSDAKKLMGIGIGRKSSGDSILDVLKEIVSHIMCFVNSEEAYPDVKKAIEDNNKACDTARTEVMDAEAELQAINRIFR